MKNLLIIKLLQQVAHYKFVFKNMFSDLLGLHVCNRRNLKKDGTINFLQICKNRYLVELSIF